MNGNLHRQPIYLNALHYYPLLRPPFPLSHDDRGRKHPPSAAAASALMLSSRGHIGFLIEPDSIHNEARRERRRGVERDGGKDGQGLLCMTSECTGLG